MGGTNNILTYKSLSYPDLASQISYDDDDEDHIITFLPYMKKNFFGSATVSNENITLRKLQ